MSLDRLNLSGFGEELEAEPYLGRDQSILGQAPFDKLLLNEKLGSDDLFRDESEQGIRDARALVLYASNFYREDSEHPHQDHFSNVAARKRIEKALKPNKRTSARLLVVNAVKLLVQYPYARDYLRLNWKPQYFDANGRPTHRTTEDVRSYVDYANNRLSYDRNSKLFGLAEELPRGFSDESDINRAINPSKTGKIRLFVMKQSGALE